MGSHMWGFQALGITPDIVTLGKPAGNGHPIGAVITAPAIADSLFKHDRYFNTFGGNPVSAVCGLAVLDILRRQDLTGNALRVGTYM
jgi:4-aminobutyrate aminotransferase-like enzyme